VSAFTIRDAVPADFDAILKLWGSIDRHTGLPDRREYLEVFHAFAPDLLLVAESEGQIIGTVIGGWDGWRAQIARLSTDEKWRRKGMAKALVREIEQRLHARGAKRIYALVDRRSPPAIPFWEAYGYATNDNIVQYSRNLGEGPSEEQDKT
jgi:ribosomal protein S18 acetylase RimI-like enzyme